MSNIRKITKAQCIEGLRKDHAGGAILYASFGHHTVQPNASNFSGMASMRGIENYHVTRCNGSMIFCHFYFGPDGYVYTGRSVFSNNCACQAPPEKFRYDMLPASPKDLMKRRGAGTSWRSWPNKYGLSCEIVGNFDHDDPAESVAFSNALDIIAEAHRLWKIPVEHAYFHRDVSFKTCPGKRVSRGWYRAELRKRLDGTLVSDALKVIRGVLPRPDVIECNAALQDGVTRVDLRPLAEALGVQVLPRLKGQNKVYLRPTAEGLLSLIEWMEDEELAKLHERLTDDEGIDE